MPSPLTNLLKLLLPVRLRLWLRYACYRLRGWLHRGDRVACPCCGGRFAGFMAMTAAETTAPRANAMCPRCTAKERHRMLTLWLERRADLKTRLHRMLHFAPEFSLQRMFRALPNLDYTSADIASTLADVHFDIQQIPYPDGSFSLILISHVLEHVKDDRQAMRELRRVLRPDGVCLVMTHIEDREVTAEDPAALSDEQRRAAYGRSDWWRAYGRDFPQRLAAAGFHVVTEHPAAELTPAEVSRYGLLPAEELFVCTRDDRGGEGS